MSVFPSKREFVEKCKKGRIPVVSSEIPFRKPADLYERVSRPYSVLLESSKGPECISRYSFIALDPYLQFRVRDELVEISSGRSKGLSRKRPLAKLKEILCGYPHAPDRLLPPFQGGAVGFFSYDFVRSFEKIPKAALDDLNIPEAHFLIVDKVIAFDHRERKTWIVLCPGARSTRLGYNDVEADFSLIYEKAVSDISVIKADIEKECGVPVPAIAGGGDIHYELTEKSYREMVMKAKEYIRAGDIFQANIAQRVSSEIGDLAPWDLYRKLSEINPSPFGAFFDAGDYFIVSSSPERLVKSGSGVAQTRPIAGTRPRGRNRKEDENLRRELLLNEKERAEHIMLIDLERNDLGKVCDYGTVEVDELMTTEEYSHVIHIVSNLRGIIAPGKDSFDLIRASFPGGTITGVPKIRCMEIIDELEPVARGPYTGSLGYIGFSGEMDLNILIRTFVCKEKKAYLHAGAGIVADSDPGREYRETMKKAEALIRTLRELKGGVR